MPPKQASTGRLPTLSCLPGRGQAAVEITIVSGLPTLAAFQLLNTADALLYCVLPDYQMREQLNRGETFCFSFGSKWQEIEQQIERLGFGDDYFVSQIKARWGKMTKVTAVPGKTKSVRHAA